MEIIRQYAKLRCNYGRQPQFCEYGPELVDSIATHVPEHKFYILRNPVHTATQHGPSFSVQEINTTRIEYEENGANHAEGGWPKDVNVMDPESTQRYRRKIEKEDNYYHCVMSSAKAMEKLILQNNAIDMYQTYYVEMPTLPEVEHTSCRTINVFRDGAGVPNSPKRPISSIAWRPDGGPIFATTYVDVNYNRELNAPIHCYIWHTERANAPESMFMPPYALLDIQYNQRNIELMAGGMINGQVAVWDRRSRDPAPSLMCPPHVAHRDFVTNVRFVNAKNGMEFFSGSPDGCCKWWDIRNMSEPADVLIMDKVSSTNEVPSMARADGISSMEFEPTIPTRFMVGTENGWVISGNRKGKSVVDKLPAKFLAHLGPVWKVERNPNFLKNFLTVGDWTARVWSEDCRESAVLWTPFHRHRITHGAWSPTKLSLVVLVQSNGVIALWDLLRNQHEAVLSIQVCQEPLLRVVPHESGCIVACGSSKGSVYMMELSRNLTESNRHDKVLMTSVLDREAKRERILEARLREIRVKQRGGAGGAGVDERSPRGSLADAEATLGDRDLHEATAAYFQVAKAARGPASRTQLF